MKPELRARMSSVGERAAERLDRIGDLLEPIKPQRDQPPFEEYRARAEARAAVDPDFRAKYQAALQQYRAAAGGPNGKSSPTAW